MKRGLVLIAVSLGLLAAITGCGSPSNSGGKNASSHWPKTANNEKRKPLKLQGQKKANATRITPGPA